VTPTRRLFLVTLATAFALAGSMACSRETANRPADGRVAVWLDLSPAFGDPPRDPGDALALLQAFGSERLHVRGVSITFGNVPLVRGFPAGQELMKRFESGLLRPWRGPSSPEERAAPTEATELLEEALRSEPLTIVAVGPATTLASVLLRQPELASRIERVVLVAGQPVDAVDGATPVSDTNVAADVASLQVILDSPAPVTLVPAAAHAPVALVAADLNRLDEGRGPIKLITPAGRAWLQTQTPREGSLALPVPAMLAVDVAAHPGALRCEAALATLTSEPSREPALTVSSTPGSGGRQVTWCHAAAPGAKARMLDDVLRLRPVQQ